MFFFDEAHLLFKDAPSALIERIELVVRLVRSKGVGVFLSPEPAGCLTPCWASWATGFSMPCAPLPLATKGRESRRRNHARQPGLDIATAITELAVGEALVSLLDDKGTPQRHATRVLCCPGSQIGLSRPRNGKPCWHSRWSAGCTKKSWTANQPTND